MITSQAEIAARLSAYKTPDDRLDMAAVLTDVIIFLKSHDESLESFINKIVEWWDEIQLESVQ